MTQINNIPDQFLFDIFGNMETDPSNLNDEQRKCICDGYDNKLEPEEIASMLDNSNMVIENER